MRYATLIEEKKLWKKGFGHVACLDEAGRGCEKPDAEILTSNGWKFYSDININKDNVLSYTQRGSIEWQKIIKVIEKDFKGNLTELKNRGINIIVTPDHYFTVIRRVFKRDKKNNNILKLVGYKTRVERKMVPDLLDNDFIPRGGKWLGTNKEFFKLSKLNRNEEKIIDIRLWVAFLGIFLAEGSTSYDKRSGSYRITISQDKIASKNTYKEIYYLLRKLPFKFNAFGEGFTCHNKQLYIYLKQFGNRYTKFIPQDIKELPRESLVILMDWMILGDGSCYAGKNRKKVCVYYTVSKKLKDDFEEVLLKAGWTYHTSNRILKDRYIGERIIKKENQVPCFEIRLRRNNKVHVKYLHKNEIFYKGKVFCLQLPQHHNFYVRRNGTGYFTGNSLAGPVTAAAVTIRRFPILNYQFSKIKDSKQLSAKQREKFYNLITKDKNIKWGIGIVSEKVIDRINILEATKLAMLKALKKVKADFLLLDGNFRINSVLPQRSIVKGDEKVFSVAASSILAKVTRDRMMRRYHKKFPKYGFDLHKGYGTKLHVEMLKRFGRCAIHRNSFHLQ